MPRTEIEKLSSGVIGMLRAYPLIAGGKGKLHWIPLIGAIRLLNLALFNLVRPGNAAASHFVSDLTENICNEY